MALLVMSFFLQIITLYTYRRVECKYFVDYLLPLMYVVFCVNPLECVPDTDDNGESETGHLMGH